ncbi:MAG: CHAT domain-containing tetratricopeptide repeat protein [Candidatus Zixiibacteriota bacterium]
MRSFLLVSIFVIVSGFTYAQHSVDADIIGHIQRADSLLNNRQFDSMWHVLDSARTVMESHTGISDSLRIIIYNELAYCALWKYDFDASGDNLRRAMDIYNSSGMPRDSLYGETLFNFGKLKYAQGFIGEAIRYIDSAIIILSEAIGPDHLYLAKLYNNIAVLQYKTFQMQSSLVNINKALEIRLHHLGPSHPLVANNLLNKGNIEISNQNYRQAEQDYKKSLAITEATYGEQHLEVIEALSNLGQTYYFLGQRERADSIFQRAERILTSAQDVNNPSVAEYMIFLGVTHSTNKNYEMAESLFKKALERQISILGEKNHQVAQTRLKYAESLAARDKDSAALEEISLAQKYLAPEFKQQVEFQNYVNALKIKPLLKLGKLEVAKAIIKSINPDDIPSLLNIGVKYEVFSRYLGQIYTVEGKYDSAAYYYGQYLTQLTTFHDRVFAYSSTRQKMAILTQYPIIDNVLLTNAVRINDSALCRVAGDMILQGKGRALEAVMAEKSTLMCPGDPYIQDAISSHRYVCAEISNTFVSNSFGSFDATEQNNLKKLLGVADSLESEISGYCREFISNPKRPCATVSEVITSLPDNCVLLEFLYYQPIPDSVLDINLSAESPPHYLACMISPEGRYNLIDLGEAGPIDSLIHHARELLDNSGVAIYNRSGAYYEHVIRQTTEELARRIWQPCNSFLADARTVCIGPDGALNLIPFEILPYDDSSYVIEHITVHYLSRGRDIVDNANTTATPKSAIVFADPDVSPNGLEIDSDSKSYQTREFDSPNIACLANEIATIPHSTIEGREITACLRSHEFEVTSYTRATATEENFKNLEHPPRILHFASHGFICNTLDSIDYGALMVNSGLILSSGKEDTSGADVMNAEDGILTALEISAADLSGTELVAVSSCESGVGDIITGEGLMGLRRAFLQAGAQSILISLWRIPDRETSELMIRFYGNWMNGQSRQSSLRNAALAVLQGQRIRLGHGHPYLWGGFILMGVPD